VYRLECCLDASDGSNVEGRYDDATDRRDVAQISPDFPSGIIVITQASALSADNCDIDSTLIK